MSQRVSELTPDELNALQVAILERLTLAAWASDLTAEFSDYHPRDIKALIRACLLTGLVRHVRGRGRGAVYHTTALGRKALISLKAQA